MREVQHGTMSGYAWDRCRCDECRAAWREGRREKVREYRARKKAEDREAYLAKQAAYQREWNRKRREAKP